MVLENLFSAFVQHIQRNSEAAVGASVPATDWNNRSTAHLARVQQLRGDVRQATVCVGISYASTMRFQSHENRTDASTESVAGFTQAPRSAAVSSPSKADRRMPPMSSRGDGLYADAQHTDSPHVLRAGDVADLRDASTRSLLLMSLATAAAISGMMAFWNYYCGQFVDSLFRRKRQRTAQTVSEGHHS